jgi:hypothetical protein
MERLQPDTLEEAKEWIAMLRSQVEVLRGEGFKWGEDLGQARGALAATQAQLKREQSIVDRLLEKDRY